MRIVAHNGARIFGGAERATVSLLRGLRDRGHDVLLLCNDELVAEESNARGVPSDICPIGGDIALHHSYRLARRLKHERPDAFIVATFKKLLHASLGAKLAGVPRVVARIGLESDIPRNAKYRFALRRWTDIVVVNARRIRRPFLDLHGFDESRVRVIWNSVPAQKDATRSTKLRRELSIADSAFVVGAVARLAKQKRLDRLIEATAKLPRVSCIIAGEGTRREALEQRARSLGVIDRVHFLGHRDDIRTVLDALDVFVVSSDSEGMSNSMLEAMAHGIAIVSTDVSGAEDALAADAQGPGAGLITAFTAESLAGAIARLENDPYLRKSLAQAARERAKTRFSREAMLSAWEDVLAR